MGTNAVGTRTAGCAESKHIGGGVCANPLVNGDVGCIGRSILAIGRKPPADLPSNEKPGEAMN